ncbi:hypothetical protein BpHYR1_034659 [Brachionus plicatilis]|uniref:Uncharacterized protein n=1 Tax=Brachionus plicatilis TaxID=10195 RepID=A0A3M7SYP5_BRAPC|nr:hypothetical protein BpHYR1_034659 [Brachionus plicatilis]
MVPLTVWLPMEQNNSALEDVSLVLCVFTAIFNFTYLVKNSILFTFICFLSIVEKNDGVGLENSDKERLPLDW